VADPGLFRQSGHVEGHLAGHRDELAQRDVGGRRAVHQLGRHVDHLVEEVEQVTLERSEGLHLRPRLLRRHRPDRRTGSRRQPKVGDHRRGEPTTIEAVRRQVRGCGLTQLLRLARTDLNGTPEQVPEQVAQ
jgi:hypothetical protein